MSISNYSELKTAIGNWLDRDDLTPYVDDFIDLAEERHKRDIRIRTQLSRANITIDARYVSLPSPFLNAQTLRIITDTEALVLKQCTLEKMNRVRREITAEPQWFTVHEQIEFDTVPDQSYTGEIIYFAPVTALSDSNTTNEILDASPSAYLYGALAAAAPFIWNDERLPVWESLYQRARDDLNLQRVDEEMVGAQISRPSGITP